MTKSVGFRTLTGKCQARCCGACVGCDLDIDHFGQSVVKDLAIATQFRVKNLHIADIVNRVRVLGQCERDYI